MAQELSKKGWIFGLLGFGIVGLVIVGQYGKASAQPEPRSNKNYHQNNLSFPF